MINNELDSDYSHYTIIPIIPIIPIIYKKCSFNFIGLLELSVSHEFDL